MNPQFRTQNKKGFIKYINKIIESIILMNFRKGLCFNSEDDIPKELKCIVCLDICKTPSLKPINFRGRNYCEDFYSTNGDSDYILSLIQVKCQLCEKYIKFFKYNQHFEKCQLIFEQTPQLLDYFESISTENYLNCISCKQICFLPMNYLNQIICRSCKKDAEQTYELPISLEAMKIYHSNKIKCKICSKIIQLFKAFRHYQKCREPTIDLTDLKEKNYRFHIFKQRCIYYHTSVQKYLQYEFECQKLGHERQYFCYKKRYIDKQIQKLNELINQQIQ
ncbi:hypothetical protein pb186bvf_005059 [Paramecium bursaria]